MGITYNPRIVTDGLVLALDVANVKSYNSVLSENLFDYSEQFNAGGWSLGAAGVTPNTSATTAPDGTNTATKLFENNTNAQHVLVQGITVSIGIVYTFSFWAKAAERTQIALTSFSEGYTAFDLSSGTILQTGGNSNVTITPFPNGWYRCSASITKTNGLGNFYFIMWNNTNSYQGVNGSGVYIWGAQVEASSSASTYYKTTGTPKTRGTTWSDISGRGNNGTLVNGPSYSSVNSGSIVFDGTNDYVQLSPQNIKSVDFSVELWFYVTKALTSAQILYTSYNLPGGAQAATFILNTNTSGRVDTSNGNTNGAIGITTLSTNTWYHLVFTYTASGSTHRTYINGNFEASGSSTISNEASSNFIGGTPGDNNAGTWWFGGRISAVKVYRNKVLSATEVSQNFNALRSRFSI